jgi:hypothetical protein
MPIRMIRDWTNSKKVNQLSSQAERFLIRLMMKADDFGNYICNIKYINGTLFPEKEDIRDIDVAKWIDECEHIQLIRRYEVDGKKYIHIYDFGQRMDKAKARYPREHEDPYFNERPELPGTFRELPGTSGKIPAELETELETEYEHEHARVTSKTFDVDENLKTALDEIYLDQEKMKWPHLDFNFELESFKNKVRGSPDDYASHDRNGIRKAFQYQLRNSKAKKPNGITSTNKSTEHVNSLMEGYKRRHGGASG